MDHLVRLRRPTSKYDFWFHFLKIVPILRWLPSTFPVFNDLHIGIAYYRMYMAL